ncbi:MULTISPECIES: hypothetical protein [Aquitalea]|uniref:hypothetical protein n=1 Tax=Aquitalea TaxID=407217 RepID=UPI000F59F0B5|nr:MULTISPECIES: hypothetical protein [Aquitalea]
MNKTNRTMLLIVLILGLAAGVYWLEQPATPPAAVPAVAHAPDLKRLAEQAVAVYRSQQDMQAGPKPGQWKLQAQASNSPGPFVGAFGPLQLARDGQGRQLLLSTFVADTADSAGEGMDSFAASGISRLLCFVLQDGQFVLQTEKQLEMGTNGMAAAARVVQLGPQEWGWVMQSAYTQQGYSASTVEFFHAVASDIRSMGRLTEQADNNGVCADAAGAGCPAVTDLQVRWQWLQQAGQPVGRFYPLDISWQGRIDGKPVSGRRQLLPDANSGNYPFPPSLNVQF